MSKFNSTPMFHVVMVILLMSAPVICQSRSRTIEWPEKSTYNSKTYTTPDNHIVDRIDDVEIETITVEGQEIIFGEPFTASDDWVKNISFRIKNVSSKKIRQVQITLILPELGPMHRIQLQYLCRDCVRRVNPINFDPGTAIDITVPDVIYEWAKGIINEQGGRSRITTAQILVSYVTFADGAGVSSDCLKTSNAKNRCPYGPR